MSSPHPITFFNPPRFIGAACEACSTTSVFTAPPSDPIMYRFCAACYPKVIHCIRCHQFDLLGHFQDILVCFKCSNVLTQTITPTVSAPVVTTTTTTSSNQQESQSALDEELIRTPVPTPSSSPQKQYTPELWNGQVVECGFGSGVLLDTARREPRRQVSFKQN